MQSLPQIQLVDIHGRPITPDDQGDASAWPASNLVDGWHWEPGEDDRAALEAEALEAETARHDAADSDSQWNRMMAEQSLPPANQISPDELAQLVAHGAI